MTTARRRWSCRRPRGDGARAGAAAGGARRAGAAAPTGNERRAVGAAARPHEGARARRDVKLMIQCKALAAEQLRRPRPRPPRGGGGGSRRRPATSASATRLPARSLLPPAARRRGCTCPHAAAQPRRRRRKSDGGGGGAPSSPEEHTPMAAAGRSARRSTSRATGAALAARPRKLTFGTFAAGPSPIGAPPPPSRAVLARGARRGGVRGAPRRDRARPAPSRCTRHHG